MSSHNEQANGNTQLNNSRNEFNERVNKFMRLGSTKRVGWTSKRRYRTI